MKHPQITQISENRNPHKKEQKAQNKKLGIFTKQMNAAVNVE
jgi:hypothetical protein